MMSKQSDKPDFIVDSFGNVQDVRNLKYKKEIVPLSTSQDARSNHTYYEATTLTSKSTSSNRSHYETSGSNPISGIIGVILIIGGFILVVGNRTGAFPTFPFAGFITMTIGWMLVKS
jgi:hypothetical protein